MLIYEELKKDHRKVLSLVDRLAKAEKMNRDERRKLVQEITDELVPHSRAEEAVFYNVLRAMEPKQNLIAHSYQEHMETEALLRALKAAEIVDIHWHNGAKKLKEILSHHIDNEENKVFEMARKSLSDEDAKRIAHAFRELKPRIKDSNMLKSSLELAINLLPKTLREKVTPLFDKTFLGPPSQTRKAS